MKGTNMRDLTEKGISSRQVFDGHLLKVYVDRVILPNGDETGREYLKHNGAVGIVVLTDDGKVIMVRQFRYPFHRDMLEIPAGKIDPGEKPIDAAKRELLEETGVTSAELTELGTYYPSVAYTDEVIWLYLARGLTYGAQHLDEDEFLNVETYPLDELVTMVMNDEIPDGKSQTAILKAKKYISGRM